MNTACKLTLAVTLALCLVHCSGVDKKSQTAERPPEAVSDKESHLRQAADQVANFANPHHSELGVLSLASKIEDEGLLQGLRTEVAASLPDGTDFPNIDLQEPSMPWTLLFKEADDDKHVIVEGYGDDLSTPLFSKLITVLDGKDLRGVARGSEPAR